LGYTLRSEGGYDIAAHGREIEDVSIATGGEDDSIGGGK
jgi:hypothetical protein